MPASLDGLFIPSHGSRLLGTFFQPAGRAPRPTVLLLHGIPGVEKNFDLAYALREAGWNCLAIHYRGCWGSEGNYSLPGIVDDIRAAVDYVIAQPEVDVQRLAGVGLSLGGWGVISTAARDERLRAVVAINPLVDPAARPLDDAEAADFAALLNGISPAEVRAQWAGLTPLADVASSLSGRPALLLTGEADALFPPEHQRPLAEAMPFAEWRRIPGAGHTFGDHRAVLVRAVADWLTQAFSRLAPLPDNLRLRHPDASDHPAVLSALRDWGGACEPNIDLPALLLQHFGDTSFLVEQPAAPYETTARGELAAFLIGFLSQSEPGVAHIHGARVHPAQRRAGLGRALYERFYAHVRARGAREVRCLVPAADAGTQAFHQRLGFAIARPQPAAGGEPDGAWVALSRPL